MAQNTVWLLPVWVCIVINRDVTIKTRAHACQFSDNTDISLPAVMLQSALRLENLIFVMIICCGCSALDENIQENLLQTWKAMNYVFVWLPLVTAPYVRTPHKNVHDRRWMCSQLIFLICYQFTWWSWMKFKAFVKGVANKKVTN